MKDLLHIFHTNLLTSLLSRYVASGYMITKNIIMSKKRKIKKKTDNTSQCAAAGSLQESNQRDADIPHKPGLLWR